MNQDAYLPQTIDSIDEQPELEQQQQQQQNSDYTSKNPYKHQGAYTIHRPLISQPEPQQHYHTTFIPTNNITNAGANVVTDTTALSPPNQKPTSRYNCSGGVITDDIRKSYVRQKLPVRQQSLAASSSSNKANNTTNTTGVQIRGTKSRNPYLSASMNDSSLSSHEEHTNRQKQKLPTRTSSIANLSSLTPPSSRMMLSAQQTGIINGKYNSIQEQGEKEGQDGEEEEEDFNFKHRPPSTIICTRPIITTDDSSNMSPSSSADSAGPSEVSSPVISNPTINIDDENVATSSQPTVPLIDTRRPSDVCSIDTITTVSTRIGGADDAYNWAYSPVSPSPQNGNPSGNCYFFFLIG